MIVQEEDSLTVGFGIYFIGNKYKQYRIITKIIHQPCHFTIASKLHHSRSFFQYNPKQTYPYLIYKNSIKWVLFITSGSLLVGSVAGHGRHFRFILILFDDGLPGISLDLIDLLIKKPLLGLLSLPRIGLNEAQLAHLLVLHQPALHAALQILDLVVAAPLGNQLVPHHAVRIFLRLVVALVEVVQGEGPAVGSLCHYQINYGVYREISKFAQNGIGKWGVGIMEGNDYYFSNTNVMYQKNSHNNARKEVFLPHTPQTRLEQRPSLYEESDVCLQHSSSLQLVCLTCCFKLLCSQCLQSPSHLNHQVRSIQRAKQMIFSQYQEWMVRLSSKKEILDIIERHFATSKADLNSFAKRYKERVSLEFSEIATLLQDKHREVVDSIDGFTREYTDEMSAHMEQIRDKMKKIQNIVEHYDKERIDLVPVSELAAYSYQIRNKVNQLLDENDIASFKEQLVEPEWSISGELLQQIKRSINALGVNFNDLYQRQPKASYIQQEKSKKKGKKEMKLFDTNSREKSQNKLKQSASSKIILQTTLTPKNKSIQKKMKQKRSPEIELLKKRKKSSAKMISMPASPAKDVETTYLITPEMSRKKLFKKK